MSLILAAGPWMAGDDATYPNRIVLRSIGDGQVVVHQQIDATRDGGRYHYGSGDYFSVDELPFAIARFADRVKQDRRYPQDTERGVAWGIPVEAKS